MKEALVIIDAINDFLRDDGQLAAFGVPAHAALQNSIANTRKALDTARARGTKVVFVRTSFSPGHPELEGVTAPFYAAHRTNNWLVGGTWGTQIHDDLAPAPGEAVIDKMRINPFTSDSFRAEIEDVDRLVIVGVATNLAVEEAVRSGAALGFDIVVLEDCCASNNAEVHAFAFANTMPRFASVSSSSAYAAE